MPSLLQTPPRCSIPGGADLQSLASPVLQQMWDLHILPVLGKHEDKARAARLEQQALQSNPGHLPGDELRQAGKALEHVLTELQEQRDVFVQYVRRIIQVRIQNIQSMFH